MDAPLIVNLTVLLGVILTFLNQRRIARREDKKVNDRKITRREELDRLEHKMVLEIAREYRELSAPLEAKIGDLTKEILDNKELLEEKTTINNELRQTIQLQDTKIKYLEGRVNALENQLRAINDKT